MNAPQDHRHVIPIRSAYELPEPIVRDELVRTGRGTAMGELLRRYWHPVGLSSDAGDTPRQIRVLGEDLILFRAGNGEPGLLHPRCAHRGASLLYGKVEDDGIRCCYHGWKFDPRGQCLEQPCEPDGGTRVGRMLQPGYPVAERYGMVWAYMGPPAKQPVLPRFEPFEQLEEGEFIEADDQSIGGGGPVIVDCNWFQHYENVVDPWHVMVLHGSFSGTQFTDAMLRAPTIRFDTTPIGVKVTSLRTLDDGSIFRRVTEACVPTWRVVPNPRVGQYARVESIGFILPIDDTHFRIYTVARVRAAGELTGFRSRQGGKLWRELTPEEHRRFPGDYEAQTSQGEITWHSHENLATSDRGIALLRRLVQQQVKTVAEGGDPAGVRFDAKDELVRFEAGNFHDPKPAQAGA
ncbi:Phenoxybenzoate dioxygenase subunit alpha [Variovorax sp. SRS16]|uniref:Rieske 2Fe-2S domain-containing protein n=1 Tax=Variovorax sp. SRS16 TaxID=282217 RepID=UPI0013167CD2|nr:Rieske 2Fe-2S domain-containing protein [Variovorax sp. SRS16]VTU15757.1 Phenoxybenzoate dioxygenase subunit alpha [Variovorax sp. SRS16]